MPSSSSSPNTNPIWPSLTNTRVDVIVLCLMLVLGIFVGYKSYLLGPGYGPTGPEPGFWPFWLNALFMVGAAVALVLGLRNPDRKPFFEATQEVIDLASVGIPVLVAVILNYWLGIFATAAVYLGFFMWWYGKFTWYTSIASGVAFAIALYYTIRVGFNLSMPMSWLYYQNITPF